MEKVIEQKQKSIESANSVIYQNSDFSSLNGDWANFQNCDFDFVWFVNAQVRHANFENCRFYQCSFEDTDLSDTKFSNCKFIEPLFGATRLVRAEFNYCDMKEAGLLKAKATDSQWRFVNLERACMKGMDIRNAVFEHTNLRDTNLKEIILGEVLELSDVLKELVIQYGEPLNKPEIIGLINQFPGMSCNLVLKRFETEIDKILEEAKVSTYSI